MCIQYEAHTTRASHNPAKVRSSWKLPAESREKHEKKGRGRDKVPGKHNTRGMKGKQEPVREDMCLLLSGEVSTIKKTHLESIMSW